MAAPVAWPLPPCPCGSFPGSSARVFKVGHFSVLWALLSGQIQPDQEAPVSRSGRECPPVDMRLPACLRAVSMSAPIERASYALLWPLWAF